MRLVPLALVVCALPLAVGAAARADGCSPATCGAQSVAVPGSRILQVRPNGVQGPLAAYDLAIGKRRFRLPPGMLSADGRRFVVAAPKKTETTLGRFDARSGRLLGGQKVRGSWALVALSSDGRHVVLQRYVGDSTVLEVVDTAKGAVVRQAHLGGNWSVETISKDGRRLYALQYLDNGYLVRLYDVARGRLVPGSVRVKGEKGPMDGLAWAGLPSPDGRWLLTLFLSSASGDEAAIHTLDLASSSAVCIDLPSRGGLQALQDYGLVLAPSGARVFAVNPVLGVVAVVDLASKKVVRTTTFPRVALPRTLAFTTAAASADGRTVYFALRGSVWAYDAAYAKVRGPYRVGGTIAGLGFSPDGRRLWVVRTDRRVSLLDAARGTLLRR